MSNDFETLFGIKESISQEEINDLKHYRGDKVSLFKLLNRRFEYLYKNSDQNTLDQLQDILYNICKYVNPNKRDELIKIEDPLKIFQHENVLKFYNILVSDGNEQLVAALPFLTNDVADWFVHQLKDVYKNNPEDVANELSYDLYYLATSGNRHITQINKPFEFVKNSELLYVYNNLNFYPELQTAFLLLTDKDKKDFFDKNYFSLKDIFNSKKLQNDEKVIDSLLTALKTFHYDNKKITDEESQKFYNELSDDMSRKQFLNLSDNARLCLAKLPPSIARNLLRLSQKNKELFNSLLFWEEAVSKKNFGASVLSTLPEEYYYLFATNKQFRNDFLDSLSIKVETKEAAETKQSIDASDKKAKDDELKKIDKDNRDTLRLAADAYAKQQYPNENKNNQPENLTKFQKLQKVDELIEGFLNAFYKQDKNTQDYIAQQSVDSIVDIYHINHNNLRNTFDMFEKLFEKGVQPTTITKVPEEVQDILYKNIYNLDNVLTCIQQQKKYGIPSTGDSPNVNLFLNRFAQLYNTKTPELAIKYADSNVNDKLQLESFVRDYSKSKKLGSEIARFLNSDKEERKNFQFNDSPNVIHTNVNDTDNNDIDFFNSDDNSTLDSDDENKYKELLEIAKKTKAIKGIYQRFQDLFGDKQKHSNYTVKINKILKTLDDAEKTKFFETLNNKIDAFRFEKCILFLIALTQKARVFIINYCSGDDAEYLCNLASEIEDGKNFVNTVNDIINEAISDNEKDIKFNFDDNKEKIDTTINTKNDSKPEEPKQINVTEPKIELDLTYLKSIEPKFTSDIIQINNDSIILFDKAFDLATPLSAVTITNNNELLTFVINSLIHQIKKIKFTKGKVDTSQRAEIENFKDNIISAKTTLETTQNKIDELNKIKKQIRNSDGNLPDLNEKKEKLSSEISELTQTLLKDFGKESNFITKLDRFKKSNDTFFLQFKNEASFLDFSSLGNEIQNTSIENINEIDFGRYKDNCDKFLNFANKGMLNETGIAYLTYMFRLNSVVENIYNYLNNLNEKRISKYRADIANYRKNNNNNITSFNAFKQSKEKPQMPNLIDEKSLKGKISTSLQNIENVLEKYVENIPELKRQYVKTFEDQTDALINSNDNILKDNSKDTIIKTISSLNEVNIEQDLSQLLNKYKKDTDKLFDDLVKEIDNIQSDLHNDNISDFDDMLESFKRNPSSNATIFKKADLRAVKINSIAKLEAKFLNQYLKLQ